MAIESLYPILGLSPQPKPSPDEIRKAYHAQALVLHPDKNPNDEVSRCKVHSELLAGQSSGHRAIKKAQGIFS